MAVDLSAFSAGLNAYAARVESVAVDACGGFAEQVLADSQELCPVSPIDAKHPYYTGHSGALRDSGTVQDPVVSGGKVSVELGYNTDYAAAVHERRDVDHKYPGAVNGRAQAKFLETAIRNSVDQFIPYVAERIAEALK